MFVTAWASEESRNGKVWVYQRLRSGDIERHHLPPFEALQHMDYDPRNGLEVVGAWIDWGNEIPWR